MRIMRSQKRNNTVSKTFRKFNHEREVFVSAKKLRKEAKLKEKRKNDPRK
jgi:hypothetical protein